MASSSQRQTTSSHSSTANLKSSFNLTCMPVICGGKPSQVQGEDTKSTLRLS